MFRLLVSLIMAVCLLATIPSAFALDNPPTPGEFRVGAPADQSGTSTASPDQPKAGHVDLPTTASEPGRDVNVDKSGTYEVPEKTNTDVKPSSTATASTGAITITVNGGGKSSGGNGGGYHRPRHSGGGHVAPKNDKPVLKPDPDKGNKKVSTFVLPWWWWLPVRAAVPRFSPRSCATVPISCIFVPRSTPF